MFSYTIFSMASPENRLNPAKIIRSIPSIDHLSEISPSNITQFNRKVALNETVLPEVLVRVVLLEFRFFKLLLCSNL